MNDQYPRQRKRRTCYDQLRKRWLDARRARTSNPAASAATQLLGIFGFILGRVPIAAPMPTPQRYVAPTMSSRHAQRVEAARRLGVPTRYLDIVLTKGRVPYPILIEHIRLGGVTRRDALDELRKTIPAETLDWLAHIEKRALWSELTRCFRPEASDDDIHVQFLKNTLAWVASQKKSGGEPSEPAERTHGLEPPKPGENRDPDDDPKPPRP
ncbi:hypothetical protein [Rhizobium metallidurans]|uniref:Uncharacterized protein n=1 Tax=Rhizobium metallidurans TaxID=1265931 RepID=A0A7W6GCE5_9HYPH|nr:hypothetical protein [Rhizobium metallidurans]MBB3965739.1 hypothetical protein [Rhizobium metallidurans]